MSVSLPKATRSTVKPRRVWRAIQARTAPAGVPARPGWLGDGCEAHTEPGGGSV